MERLSRWLGLALVLLFVGVVAAQEEGNEINFIFAGMLPERRSTSPHPADRIFYAQGSSLYGPDFGRTYYRESGDGVPLAVGFEMTENTPVVLGKAIPTSSLYSVLFLDLPQEARIKTPLQFMTAHFSPIGHPPAGLWTVPHFDIHFFFLRREEVLAMSPVSPPNEHCPAAPVPCDIFERMNLPVPSRYLPDGWQRVGAPVPFMGDHVFNPADVIPGQFTRTVLYGVYDGLASFIEPMITSKFFMEKHNECNQIAQPEAFAFSGYYPTEYCILFDENAHVHRVELTTFVWREGDATVNFE